MNVLKGYLETLRLFIARLAAAIIILPMTVRKVRDFSQLLFLEKDKKKQEEEITPEEELHKFLQDIKKDKDQREKYKAITGKEAPRELKFEQFEAEMQANSQALALIQ